MPHQTFFPLHDVGDELMHDQSAHSVYTTPIQRHKEQLSTKKATKATKAKAAERFNARPFLSLLSFYCEDTIRPYLWLYLSVLENNVSEN